MVVLVHGDTELATWPVPDGGRPDLTVVDELARLQLAARRLGCSILLRDAGAPLHELLELVGVLDVLTRPAHLCGQVGGQAEDGEEVGVQEAVVPDDPVA